MLPNYGKTDDSKERFVTVFPLLLHQPAAYETCCSPGDEALEHNAAREVWSISFPQVFSDGLKASTRLLYVISMMFLITPKGKIDVISIHKHLVRYVLGHLTACDDTACLANDTARVEFSSDH